MLAVQVFRPGSRNLWIASRSSAFDEDEHDVLGERAVHAEDPHALRVRVVEAP
jgi:hypothetical protein